MSTDWQGKQNRRKKSNGKGEQFTLELKVNIPREAKEAGERRGIDSKREKTAWAACHPIFPSLEATSKEEEKSSRRKKEKTADELVKRIRPRLPITDKKV